MPVAGSSRQPGGWAHAVNMAQSAERRRRAAVRTGAEIIERPAGQGEPPRAEASSGPTRPEREICIGAQGDASNGRVPHSAHPQMEDPHHRRGTGLFLVVAILKVADWTTTSPKTWSSGGRQAISTKPRTYGTS